MKYRLLTLILVIAWLSATGFGLSQLHAYMNTPGRVGVAPHLWPQQLAPGLDKQLYHTPGQPHLLVFLHRQCPCSSATLTAIGSLGEIPRLTVIFVGDPSETSRTGRTLEAQAAELTVHLVNDTTGQLAEQFGALTSGYVVAYDAQGVLAYTGGVTPGRGMLGPAGGQRSLQQLFTNQPMTHDTHAVYGCPLVPEADSQPSCCPPQS